MFGNIRYNICNKYGQVEKRGFKSYNEAFNYLTYLGRYDLYIKEV